MSGPRETLASSTTLHDTDSPERRELSSLGPDINDSQFMAHLQQLKELRSFLIEQAVPLKPTESNKLLFRELNLLRLNRNGRSPTAEEWESLETLRQELFSHLSDPLRRRFLSTHPRWWVPWLTVGLGLMAVFSLVMCSLTWGYGGYNWIFPWYVLWLASLGALGSTSFIGMNALSIQDGATFDLTNTRLLVLRVALGSLFGVVLTLPLGFRSFVVLTEFLHNGGLNAGGQSVGVSLVQESALLLLPFVLGFSTSLMIMVLNQIVDAVQTLFSKPVAANSPPAGPERVERASSVQNSALKNFEAFGAQSVNTSHLIENEILGIDEEIVLVSLVDYKDSLAKAAVMFAHLTTWEAIRTFPSQSIVAISAVVGVYLGQYLHIVKAALADEHSFSPPLGLPQSIFTDLVIGIAILFAILVLGLFYSGYIAKPKNQGAANAVSHLVTFLSGALLGVRAG
jgi:hypothetical protein